MTRLFDKYRLIDGDTEFSEAGFNPTLESVDARIHALEEISASIDAAITNLTRIGLDRINELLGPVSTALSTYVELGFMSGRSESSVTFEAGAGSLVIEEGEQRDLFVPSPFVAIMRSSTFEDYAIAQTTGYEKSTGTLVYTVIFADGDPGPHSDLRIYATPGVAVAFAALAAAIENASVDTETAEAAAATATTKAGEAATSATAASGSATVASGSVTAAQAQAVLAAGHASTANGSATAAAASAAAAALASATATRRSFWLAATA